MEAVTYEKLIPRLIETLPEFSADPEWVDGRLTYLVFGDLMTFINSLLGSDPQGDVLQRVFGLLEEAAKANDPEIEALMKDCLPVLLENDPEKGTAYMGRATRKTFRRIRKEAHRGA